MTRLAKRQKTNQNITRKLAALENASKNAASIESTCLKELRRKMNVENVLGRHSTDRLVSRSNPIQQI